MKHEKLSGAEDSAEAFSLEPQLGFIGAGIQQVPFAVLSAPKAEAWSVENCHRQPLLCCLYSFKSIKPEAVLLIPELQ